MAADDANSRSPILRLFDAYLTRYPDESTTVDRIRAFVTRNPDCFRRQLLEGHITGSAWVVDKTMRRVLLTHHRKLGIWVQLGGHADGESDVAAVALREATEESGLQHLRLLSPDLFDIDIHTIPARRDEPEHLHYDCRFLIQAEDEDYVVSSESHDLAWIELGRVGDYTAEASVLRMVQKTSR